MPPRRLTAAIVCAAWAAGAACGDGGGESDPRVVEGGGDDGGGRDAGGLPGPVEPACGAEAVHSATAPTLDLTAAAPEDYKDVDAALALDGDALARGFSLRASPALHHMRLVDADPGALAQGGCDDVTFGKTAGLRWLWATSTSSHAETFCLPEGLGIPLGPARPVCLNYHYVNSTDLDRMDVAVDLHVVAADAPLVRAGMFAFLTRDIVIPPRSPASAAGDCRFPNEVTVVALLPHTHAFGTAFVVEWAGGDRDGEVVAEWGEDVLITEQSWLVLDAPVVVPGGQGFRFRCDYDNPTGAKVVKGPYSDNEMCTLAGIVHPAERTIVGIIEPGSPECSVQE